MNSVKIDELDQAINDELSVYSSNITDKIKEITVKSTKKLVKLTKDSAPIGKRTTHHFKQDITSKTLTETPFELTKLWYVKSPSYRLTHLLEHGHATRNGGRVPGTHFISKAWDKVQAEYEHEVEEAIKDE